MAEGLSPGLTLRLAVERREATETVATQLEYVSAAGIEVLVPMKKLRRMPLPTGTAVRASYSYRRLQWHFRSEVLGTSADGNAQFLRLPDEISCSERRNGYRLPTHIKPKALYRLVIQRDALAEEDAAHLHGTVVDLSEGGLCLSSTANLDFGERLGIQADLDRDLAFSARMQITEVEEPGAGNRNRRLHCQFINISQSDRDNVAKYLIRRQLEMRRRGQL